MVSEKIIKQIKKTYFIQLYEFSHSFEKQILLHTLPLRTKRVSKTEEHLYYANGPWIHLWASSQRRNREEWVETFKKLTVTR